MGHAHLGQRVEAGVQVEGFPLRQRVVREGQARPVPDANALEDAVIGPSGVRGADDAPVDCVAYQLLCSIRYSHCARAPS